MTNTRLALAFLVASLTACSHSEPFSIEPNEPLGPFPRNPAMQTIQQLTFNRGDDRDPSVLGDVLVFSRLEPARQDGDRCIAFMPVAGGTLTRQVCGGEGIVNSTRDAWLNPIVSPDGALIAYVSEQSSALFNVRVPSSRVLAAAPVDDIENTTELTASSISLAAGAVNDFQDLQWVDATTVRFIGGTGGFNSLTNDTTFASLGLFDWDVTTGATSRVEGVFNPLAYTVAPDGGVWFISQTDSTTIFHLPRGEATAVDLGVDWSRVSPVEIGGMWDIGDFEGKPVVTARVWEDFLSGPEMNVLILDIAGASANVLWSGGVPRSIAKIPGARSVVVEVESGGSANLWLAELP